MSIYDEYAWRKAVKNFKFKSLTLGKVDVSKQIENESFQVTLDIMFMVKKRAKERPIYMFNACGNITKKEELICSKTNITCIPGISEYVDLKEKQGNYVKVVNDGHWNFNGNMFAGKALVDYFENFFDINNRTTSCDDCMVLGSDK